MTDIEAARETTAAPDDDLAPARGLIHGLLNALPFVLLFWAVFLKALGVW
jgi:hypothetical protein